MVVGVVFRGTPYKIYDYLTDLPLCKGDLVVVPTGPLAKGDTAGISERFVTVARVVRRRTASAKAFAWVIQKVDMTAFVNRMDGEIVEAMLE